jgi:hypothetical protein
MASVRVCKACNESKDLDAFEKTTKTSRRAVCKPCYSRNKADVAKAAASLHDPATVPKPVACIECSRGVPEVDFKWRSDIKKGGWRTICVSCTNDKGYSATSRAKRRAGDEEAYLAKNAAQAAKWRKANPDKKQHQDKTRMAKVGGAAGVLSYEIPLCKE